MSLVATIFNILLHRILHFRTVIAESARLGIGQQILGRSKYAHIDIFVSNFSCDIGSDGEADSKDGSFLERSGRFLALGESLGGESNGIELGSKGNFLRELLVLRLKVGIAVLNFLHLLLDLGVFSHKLLVDFVERIDLCHVIAKHSTNCLQLLLERIDLSRILSLGLLQFLDEPLYLDSLVFEFLLKRVVVDI